MMRLPTIAAVLALVRSTFIVPTAVDGDADC
jgi:hypothetical protein